MSMKNGITNLLTNYSGAKRSLNAYRFFLMVAALSILSVSSAHAQSVIIPSGLSAQSILQKIGQQVPNFTLLVTAVGYVVGMFFVITGVIRMKHLGESRTMMSREHSAVPPLIYIAVGAALLYLPSSVWVGMNTFWTSASPYAYTENTDTWSTYINVCFEIVQLIGVIAFIRGLIILSKLGEHGGGQQGQFGKGLTHIIGGIFCINIYQFIQMISYTIGIQFGS